MKRVISIFMATRIYIPMIPVLFFFLGATLNQSVSIANGGKFPVMINDFKASELVKGKNTFAAILGIEMPDLPDGYVDDHHVLMTADTKLNWLADYINRGGDMISPGDLLLDLGDILFSYALTVWATLAVSDMIRARARRLSPDVADALSVRLRPDPRPSRP